MIVAVCCICYAGEVAGVLCGVEGEGVCGELLPYITGLTWRETAENWTLS